MGRADYLAVGQYNFICDQCGKKRKSKDMVKQWDGLIVCHSCLDPRHPQEFVKARADDQTVPVSRPSSDPTFVAEATALTVTE